jgi:glutaminyl-tRNA synthetase
MFTVANPAAVEDFTTVLNPDSLVITQGFIEPSLLEAKAQQGFQFERLGYFCFDGNKNADGKLIFNKTVGLRDTWTNNESK